MIIWAIFSSRESVFMIESTQWSSFDINSGSSGVAGLNFLSNSSLLILKLFRRTSERMARVICRK